MKSLSDILTSTRRHIEQQKQRIESLLAMAERVDDEHNEEIEKLTEDHRDEVRRLRDELATVTDEIDECAIPGPELVEELEAEITQLREQVYEHHQAYWGICLCDTCMTHRRER